MARKPREFFKASDWELEDAEEESVRDRRQPRAQVASWSRTASSRACCSSTSSTSSRTATSRPTRVLGEEFFPCDDVILAIGQENAFPWIERDIGIEFDKWDLPMVDKVTFQSTPSRGVLRRRRGVRPEEHHLGGGARPPGRHLDPQATASGEPVTERLPRGVTLAEPQDGHARVVATRTTTTPLERRLVPHVGLIERFKKINVEVELGFTAEQAALEVQRCLNCDVQTVFAAKLCIECDACIDICPVDCLTIAPNGAEARAALAPQGAGANRRRRCSSRARCRRPGG